MLSSLVNREAVRQLELADGLCSAKVIQERLVPHINNHNSNSATSHCTACFLVRSDMTLSDFLAQQYLTADPAPPSSSSKKRKRKDKDKHSKSSTSGLVIADDDAPFTTAAPTTSDDESPFIVSDARGAGQFRKAKKNAWKTVGAAAPSSADQAAADRILQQAEADRKGAGGGDDNDEDNAPQIVGGGDDDEPRMESGARAGLQTAAQVKAAMDAKRAAERARFDAEGAAASGAGQETIYRDASGRVINVAMQRAEARRKAAEEEARKAAEQEALRGDVQRLEKAERAEKLKDAKFLGVARYADDVELNEELKDRDRWNDPAAQFMVKKKEKKSKTGKPVYTGAAAPNRYGIRPGYRWDGVDRSIGFEKQWFEARNKKESIKNLEYAWQMDE